MYKQDRIDAAKAATSKGYKQSAYDSNKFIKETKMVSIGSGSIKVGDSKYPTSSAAKKSSKW